MTEEIDYEKAWRGAIYENDAIIRERDELGRAVMKLLANADWRVGGALTPQSKRSDFQSSGYSMVKTRDLASLRDIMEEAES